MKFLSDLENISSPYLIFGIYAKHTEIFRTYQTLALPPGKIYLYDISMELNELLENLKKCKALNNLTDAQLLAVVKAGKTLQAEAGQLLFKEGDDSVAMYFLFQGQVDIKGKAGNITSIRQYELFGEMGVVSKTPRSATMTAFYKSTIFALPRDKFYELIAADKDFGYQFYKNLVDVLIVKLRKNNETVEFSQLLLT
jgi:CRP-like cAMP-binding protein